MIITVVTGQRIVFAVTWEREQIDITEQSGSKVISNEHQVLSRPTRDISKVKRIK